MKRIAFDLVGLQDFTIEGADTKLLFTGFVSPFNLERCRNITIRNLSIDFTRTFHSEVPYGAAGNGWLDLEFPDKYRCDLTDGCLRFLDDEVVSTPIPVCWSSIPNDANRLSTSTTTGSRPIPFLLNGVLTDGFGFSAVI